MVNQSHEEKLNEIVNLVNNLDTGISFISDVYIFVNELVRYIQLFYIDNIFVNSYSSDARKWLFKSFKELTFILEIITEFILDKKYKFVDNNNEFKSEHDEYLYNKAEKNLFLEIKSRLNNFISYFKLANEISNREDD